MQVIFTIFADEVNPLKLKASQFYSSNDIEECKLIEQKDCESLSVNVFNFTVHTWYILKGLCCVGMSLYFIPIRL